MPYIKIKDGVVSIKSGENLIFESIINEKIDIRRIFKCPVCQRIVWKKQITAKTCGGRDKCAQRHKYLKSILKPNHEPALQKNINSGEVSEERIRERKEWLNKDFSTKEK